MERLFCHLCDQEVDFEVRNEEFIYTVRNDVFLITGSRAFCKIHSDEELFHKQFDMENQEKAFHLYREKHDIISPKEIKEIREKYDLSQREFSQLLGFGEITISRYERGSLPTLVQNQIIKDSFNPTKMLAFLDKNIEKISENKSIQLKIILDNLLTDNPSEETIVNEIRNLFHHDPDIYSGNKTFDFNKFANMVWFFSKKDRPYLTKLNKLMFYADYYFFKQYNVSLSGGKYIRDYYGPVPEKFRTLYDNIKSIEIIENEHGSFTSPISNISEEEVFIKEELEILNFVYEKYKDMYSSEIRDFSHEENCWIETPNKNLIPYSFAGDLDMYREYKK